MGRSRCTFVMPHGSRESALRTAAAVGQSNGYRVAQMTPNYIVLTAGAALWAGERNFTLMAVDTPQGVLATVQAWVEGMFEISANPRRIMGMWPRRKLWRMVDEICRRLGVPDPAAVFQH